MKNLELSIIVDTFVPLLNDKIIKIMTIASIIREKNQTIYQKIALEFSTTVEYVGKIARGQRTPRRGKGLEVYKRLTEYCK